MSQKVHVMHGRDHLTTGADPIPGLPPPLGGPGLADTILASPGLDAFWKLDEVAGTTAADSSGNGYHMTGNFTPLWADEVSTATGSPAPKLTSGSGQRFTRAGYSAAAAGDFTAVVWFKLSLAPTSYPGTLFGEGSLLSTGGAGWGLIAENTGKLAVKMGNPYDTVRSDNALSTGVWYMAATTVTSGLWKLYLDGLQQADTSTVGGTATGDIWLANTTGNLTRLQDGWLSYAAVWDRALSGAEILDLFNHAGSSAAGTFEPAGAVLTSDGAGGSVWDYPNMRVYLNGA